jgi:hypothetical protein
MSNRLAPNRFITKTQGDNLRQAIVHANHQGMPFNYLITVHWANAGMKGNYRQCRQKLLELVGKFFYRRKSPWAGIWVTEGGKLSKEVHVHIAVHLPDDIPLRVFKKYLQKIVRSDDSGEPDVRDVYDIHGLLGYLLKGCDPELYDYFQIPDKHRIEQGVVFGKRCGCTSTIDAQARSLSQEMARAARAEMVSA